MVEEIESTAAPLAAETGVAKFSPRVLKALTRDSTSRVCASRMAAGAYKNRALSIGQGQTISQPFIVALMSELLQLGDTDKVLEVGPDRDIRPRSFRCSRGRYTRLRSSPELGTRHDVLARLG